MLRAVPVEGFDVDEDGALGRRFLFGNDQVRQEVLSRPVALVDLGAAEDLEPLLAGVVHEEECNTVIVLEIAHADVLLVSAQVGVAESAIVEDAQEAF